MSVLSCHALGYDSPMPSRPASEGDEVHCARCRQWHRPIKLEPNAFVVGRWLHIHRENQSDGPAQRRAVSLAVP
jgi:hypothetical protein